MLGCRRLNQMGKKDLISAKISLDGDMGCVVKVGK
jgi:hypothetical protein